MRRGCLGTGHRRLWGGSLSADSEGEIRPEPEPEPEPLRADNNAGRVTRCRGLGLSPLSMSGGMGLGPGVCVRVHVCVRVRVCARACVCGFSACLPACECLAMEGRVWYDGEKPSP